MNRRGGRRLGASTLLVCITLAATACASPRSSTAPAASALPQGDEPAALKPGDFTADIDNPYWPMEPGTQWTLSGDGRRRRGTHHRGDRHARR